jgi:hypothetical protein
MRDRRVRVVSTGQPVPHCDVNSQSQAAAALDASIMVWGLDAGAEKLERCFESLAKAPDNSTLSLTVAVVEEQHRAGVAKVVLTRLSGASAWHSANGVLGLTGASVAVVPDPEDPKR